MPSTANPEPRTYVTHLECSATGEHYPSAEPIGLSGEGKPLLVRYDLDGIKAGVDRDSLASRPDGMWRYRELLPVENTENIVSLGEAATPLLRLLHSPNVLVKDEGRLPTGSFKARGVAVAVSMAKELGIDRVAMASNGNAGAALAAYATRAGMVSYVFCPEDTPEVNVREIALQGARVWRVNGLIDVCGGIVAAGREPMGWFDVSTLNEPYRIEGKKTMGIELAEQLGWEVPDVIFYPTGGGTGLIGMWKAFQELRHLGWIGETLPRMVAVQSTGCAPIVKAWEEGAEHAERWEDAETIAAGIRVPAAIGDFLMLRAIRESDGFALAVPDAEIQGAQERIAGTEGLLTSPEGAATVAGYERALDAGLVDRSDRVVLFNCGNGLKYPMPPADRVLDHRAPIDWESIAAG
jgi:threonine synthase